MHALELLRGKASREVKPLYAVFGDDAYLKKEVLDALTRAVLGPEADELAVSRFAGEHASLADVLDEVRTLPFLTRRRLVVVENADPFVTAHRRELEGYAEHASASGVLVLVVKTWPGNTRLARLFAQHGLAVECKSPREAELPDWLVELAREHEGVALEREAARLLVELVGPEVGLLASEVAKLATYVGPKKAIKRADVARMVGAGRVETIWKTLEAATTGQAAEGLDGLDRLLTSGEHPVGLLAAISASLRKVHHAGMLRKARKELREACREAGIPSFPGAIELTQKQHAHLGPARVEALPELLLRTDLELKGASALDPRVVLERFFIKLARPRRD
jgi:DNA polymerase-3 subunit delta